MHKGYRLVVFILGVLIALGGVVFATEQNESRSEVQEITIPPEWSVTVGIRSVWGDKIVAIATTSVEVESSPNQGLAPGEGTGAKDVSGLRPSAVDVEPPVIDGLYSDGESVATGDYISRLPVISVGVSDSESDIATWSIVLSDSNNTVIASANGENSGALVATATLTIASALGNGSYMVQVTVWDAASNYSTKIFSDLRADSKLKLKELLSGPNPFNPNQSLGAIEYQLSQAADVDIKIVSMSGRVIWHEYYDSGDGSAKAGFNRVVWDGRDSSGDTVANGPYLVIVVAKSGSDVVTKRSRLLVMR